MPKKLERKLKTKAKTVCRDRPNREKCEDAYVYGTMRKAGWKPRRERK